MSKALIESQVTTAKARSRLEAGVHWRRIDAEAHLGYRKGKRGGIWLVRWRNHYDGASYKQSPVGTANDVNDKPAAGMLTFQQASKTAGEVVARARAEAAAQAAGPAPTVRSAVEAYIKERDDREKRRTGRDIRSDAANKLRRHVLGQDKRGTRRAIEAAPLAAVHLHALKEDDLLTWRERLPKGLKVTTKQRLMGDLRAALNASWPRLSAKRKKLNPTFLTDVRTAFKAERIDDDDETSVARDNQILTDQQISNYFKKRWKLTGSRDTTAICIISSFVWPRPARGMPRSGVCAWATYRSLSGVSWCRGRTRAAAAMAAQSPCRSVTMSSRRFCQRSSGGRAMRCYSSAGSTNRSLTA